MQMLKAIINLFRFDRTNWRAAFLCMLAALVFWLFNALNKNYSTNIKFPVHFDFSSEKYSPVEALPPWVNLNVSGTGWELFREYMGFKQPELNITLERPTEVKKIVGASLTPLLAPQLGKLKINYVVTDTLKVHIDEIDSHRFKVFADLSDINYETNFGRISPVVILPDSVELTGPKSVLHLLPDSIQLFLSANRLRQNFEDDIEIKTNNIFIKRNPPLVNVMFEVGEVLEQKLNVTLSIKNSKLLPTAVWPDSLSCIFLVPAKRMEEFNRIKKDLRLILDGKNKIATPTLQKKPEFIELLRIDSIKRSLDL